jgi:anthranilate phosphoribosyltransferase
VSSFASIFDRLASPGADVTCVREGFDAILAGEWTSVQIAAFAAALRFSPLGRDYETLVAGARALRATMTAVEHGLPDTLDTCGTGGDGRGTLNVSTAAALLLAGLGVHVAKHGNRSVSSRSGSADVLEAMGLPIDVPPAHQAEILRRCHIAFLMAPAHHPALRHAAPTRRELGVRTIFNALGPLANPAQVSVQLVGVYDDELRERMARALGALGVSRAWVVRSCDGTDEISPEGETRVSILKPTGEVEETRVRPEDFGIAPSSLAHLDGGGPDDNARALFAILRGEPHPAAPAVVINAAAALHLVRGISLRDAAHEVERARLAGLGARTFEDWKRVAESLR